MQLKCKVDGVDCGSITMRNCVWSELPSNPKHIESHEWPLAGTCHIEGAASNTTQERSYKTTQTRLLVSRWKQKQARGIINFINPGWVTAWKKTTNIKSSVSLPAQCKHSSTEDALGTAKLIDEQQHEQCCFTCYVPGKNDCSSMFLNMHLLRLVPQLSPCISLACRHKFELPLKFAVGEVHSISEWWARLVVPSSPCIRSGAAPQHGRSRLWSTDLH